MRTVCLLFLFLSWTSGEDQVYISLDLEARHGVFQGCNYSVGVSFYNVIVSIKPGPCHCFLCTSTSPLRPIQLAVLSSFDSLHVPHLVFPCPVFRVCVTRFPFCSIWPLPLVWHPAARWLKMCQKCHSSCVLHCFHCSGEGFLPSAAVFFLFPNTWVRQVGGVWKILTDWNSR